MKKFFNFLIKCISILERIDLVRVVQISTLISAIIVGAINYKRNPTVLSAFAGIVGGAIIGWFSIAILLTILENRKTVSILFFGLLIAVLFIVIIVLAAIFLSKTF